MDALQSVKQALQLAPDDPRCYVILAQVGIAAGNENVVRSALSRLHALDPSHPLLEALTRGQGGSSLPTAGV
jgi:cytochrome c-type biogenesis protein CcmH/NrfG